MNDVFDQGVQFVIDNLAAISTELQANAASGVKKFTLTLTVSFEPNNLRLKGDHMKSYFAGIRKGFADEDIYEHEVAVALNESQQTQLQIDLIFTL